MKKTALFFMLLSFGVISFSQTPGGFSYQAVVRNSDGQVVKNQSISVRVSILQGSINGTAVYTETFTPVTNDFGLINLTIGQGSTGDDFSAIDWENGPYFLQLETDLSGGGNYETTGTVQLLSVPYALHAKEAENVFSGNYDDLTNKPDLSVFLTSETDPEVGSNTTNYFSKWDGTALVSSSLYETDSHIGTASPIFANGGVTTPSLTLGGDTRTFWNRGETGRIPFWVTSDSLGLLPWYYRNGKTGIGLSSPAYTLDISGSLQASDTLLAGKYLIVPHAIVTDSISWGNPSEATGIQTFHDSSFLFRSPASSSYLVRYLEGNKTRFSVTGKGELKASSLIDTDDSTYVLDPNGKSVLHRLTAQDIRFSDISGVTFHSTAGGSYFITPHATSYMNVLNLAGTLTANTCTAFRFIDMDDESYFVSPAGASRMKNVYAEKIVDLDLSTYFLDPNSNSVVYNFTVNNRLQGNNVYAYRYIDQYDNDYYLRPSGKSVLTDAEVKGHASIGGPLFTKYSLYVYGDAYSTGSWLGSDKRWKKDITPLGNELPKIMKLQGVHYYWKTDKYPEMGFDHDLQIGLIAQEVEKIFPELVKTDEKGYKAISYAKLTVILMEALKEQQKMISRQQQSIEQLQQEIAHLKK